MEEDQKLPVKVKLGYGVGDLGGNLYFTVIAFWLLNYFTDTVGIAAGVAGIAFGIGKIWDAVTDPLMGYISDRNQEPLGTPASLSAVRLFPLVCLHDHLVHQPAVEQPGRPVHLGGGGLLLPQHGLHRGQCTLFLPDTGADQGLPRAQQPQRLSVGVHGHRNADRCRRGSAPDQCPAQQEYRLLRDGHRFRSADDGSQPGHLCHGPGAEAGIRGQTQDQLLQVLRLRVQDQALHHHPADLHDVHDRHFHRQQHDDLLLQVHP